MSWPMMLRRPSQRRGASSAHRTSHDERRASALRLLESSTTSFTIVREALRDESRALLRIRVARRRRGGVFDHPPLATLADAAKPADHVRADAIDQRELVAFAQRARIA